MLLFGYDLKSLLQPPSGLFCEEYLVILQRIFPLRFWQFQPYGCCPLPGKLEVGWCGITQLDLQVAFLGYLLCVCQCLRNVCKQPCHLLGRFDIEFVH